MRPRVHRLLAAVLLLLCLITEAGAQCTETEKQTLTRANEDYTRCWQTQWRKSGAASGTGQCTCALIRAQWDLCGSKCKTYAVCKPFDAVQRANNGLGCGACAIAARLWVAAAVALAVLALS
eukprot:TRINITY_DN44798_c0_g1_i1.p2 TRINITY_DN44798_c0_g1~~TRINITY_DN44798_c0_g1_i1.p2  ORF type:complete len:122 (+),score=30.73 TRINITY_DN44798_c0_g1_i1:61-426(+)